MPGKYSVDDLLKLRASPLISKPPNLPAIEEILSAQDLKPQRPSTRRGADDTSTTPESFPKRPILDSQRKSTTDPERIVLGPPRRSFASSNTRTGGKFSLESTEESQGTKERNGLDRFKNGDPDRYPERRINGRFSKHDQEGSTDETSRKRVDDNDSDNKTRRDHDRRPKWAADEDGDRESRPDRTSRTKFEQSWLRPDRGADPTEEFRRDPDRGHNWRDKRQDRGWDRPAFVEDDPEWMDTPAEEEKQAPARTQEDFQRWKEKMKAGKSASAPDEAILTPSSPEPFETKAAKPLAPILDAEPDDSMDKFFARFNDTKITADKPVNIKPTTKTRFASLFGPPPDAPPEKSASQPPPNMEQPTSPPPPYQGMPDRPSSESPNADADQAGFARIMEMLKNRSNNGPLPTQDFKTRLPPHPRDGQLPSDPDRAQQPPTLLSLLGQPQNTGKPQQLGSQDRFLESRSPLEPQHGRQQSQKNDALLDLLRQANQAAKPTPIPQQRYNTDTFLGMMNQNAMLRNQMISPMSPPDPSVMAMLGRPENGRGPPIDEQQRMQYREEPLPRRPTNGDGQQQDQLLSFVRGYHAPQQPSNVQPPQGLPPGLGRPPGLDMGRPPPRGWPAQPPPPQQQPQPQPQPRHAGVPPGMPGPLPPSGIGPTQFGGPSAAPPQRPQQPSQRKYTGEGPQFPPNMAPPGFGPPPGFQGYGGPQGMSRPQFMDMYGDGRGLRGNATGGMPGYR